MNDKTSFTLQLHLVNTNQILTFSCHTLTIGREQNLHPNNDNFLALPLQTLSRQHAILFFEDETWKISDCNSTNGTWVNGKKLSPNQALPLSVGDVIELANSFKIIFLKGEHPSFPEEATPHPSMPLGMPCTKERDMPVQPMAAPMPSPSMSMSSPSIPMPPQAMNAPSQAMRVPPQPMGAPSLPMSAPSQPMTPAKPKEGFLARTFKKIGALSSKKDKGMPAFPNDGPVTADDVQFRCTAPKAIRTGEYFPVKIMMYQENDFQRADRESAYVAEETKSATSSIFQAQLNDKFRIALQSPDLELDCETQQLNWNGKYACADFEIFLPEGYSKSQLRLHGRIYHKDAVLTDLKIMIQVGSALNYFTHCEKVQLRSAFISYASADRAKVVARIQGIQLACPDMDIFFDVESLRRGENWEPRLYQEISKRELFYLFWSQNAASSEWVQKELEYAVANKTIDYIEPIPLESPDTCSPPECLNCKHFNDWTLRYLQNQ